LADGSLIGVLIGGGLTLAGGLLGTFGTQWATSRREAKSRLVAFKKQQLEQFYGPLLAMYKEVRARSELRVKLQNALDEPHLRAMLSAGPDRVERVSDQHVPAIVANVQDEMQTFRDVLMPRYREMITTFGDKMWLAEPETRAYFGPLIEFVDVWDKILAKTLPPSAAIEINHTERNLHPFYQNLEVMNDRLRREIS
jgi:hypothetical protein